MTKAERSKLRNETNTKNFRSALEEMHGVKCLNCGTTEHIEWHHIVPLACGGTNNKENIIPLCHCCHMAVHHGMDVLHYSNNANRGGRPSKAELDSKVGKYLDMYIYGKIGKVECARLTGYSKRTLGSNRVFKQYLKSKGIVEFRNLVDVVGTNSQLLKGRQVGYVIYDDGRKELTFYTGDRRDNRKYKKRGLSHLPSKDLKEEVRKEPECKPVEPVIKKTRDEDNVLDVVDIDFFMTDMSHLDDSKSDAYDMYVSGRIGVSELAHRLGCLQSTVIMCPAFDEYRRKKHITRILNKIDELNASHDLKQSSIVGYVLYDDGTREPIVFIGDESKLAV